MNDVLFIIILNILEGFFVKHLNCYANSWKSIFLIVCVSFSWKTTFYDFNYIIYIYIGSK